MNSRPLSPHLQIYHPAMTMMMSVAHRLSGLGLYASMLGFAAWLAMLAFDPAFFNQGQIWAAHPIGQMILFLPAGYLRIIFLAVCGTFYGIQVAVWVRAAANGSLGARSFLVCWPLARSSGGLSISR